jgi:hypothetical protein
VLEVVYVARLTVTFHFLNKTFHSVQLGIAQRQSRYLFEIPPIYPKLADPIFAFGRVYGRHTADCIAKKLGLLAYEYRIAYDSGDHKGK